MEEASPGTFRLLVLKDKFPYDSGDAQADARKIDQKVMEVVSRIFSGKSVCSFK